MVLPEGPDLSIKRLGAGYSKDNKVVSMNKVISENRKPAPLTSFRYFSRLPVDARHRIWKYSLPQATAFIELILSKGDNVGADGKETFKLVSKTRVPALLHVNYEARSIGLKLYDRLEIETTKNAGLTYIQFPRDILVITTHDTLARAMLNKQLKENLYRLTISLEMKKGSILDDKRLEAFSNLREVFVADCWRGGEFPVFYGWHEIKRKEVGDEVFKKFSLKSTRTRRV